MTAQEELLRRDRDAHDELVENVRNAAIKHMQAQVNLQLATRAASDAEEEFALAIDALKQYKGSLE